MSAGSTDSGQVMEALADTGMVGGAAAIGITLAESGLMPDASAGVVGAIAAVVLRALLALTPDLIAYARARIALWRHQAEEDLDEVTGEHKPGGDE